MNFYDDLVMQTQMNYSRHYHIYASGGTPYQLTDKKPLPYSEQIHRLVQEVKEADCVVVGGASGLSAAGGGDFYYEDNDSYRKYFRPFAEKYHFKGAFAGMMHPWKTREEYWGYLATFLHTTQTAPVRHSYLDLDALLKGKDFFILTTNQDTQFVKVAANNIEMMAVDGSDIQIPVDTRLAMVATLQQSVEVGDHILHICQVDKFLGDEDKKGLYAWNGFGKVAPAAEG